MDIDRTNQQFPFARLGDARGYDLIGDVHGCAQTLARLLEQMGYQKHQGVYRHGQRQAIFLGDIVDRGPRIREALHLVHDMVEKGSALMILGNHELNAITYSTPVTPGARDYLRPHIASNNRQIVETLEQFANYSEDWQCFLAWFMGLPLHLEIIHPTTAQVFRAVHACWDQALIDLHRQMSPGGYIDSEFIQQSVRANTPAAKIKRRLTGGVDLALPEGMSITSEDGYTRRNFRTKFWAGGADTYGELLFQPDPLPETFAASQISRDHRTQMVSYGLDQPPLFVGHYWLRGHPAPLTANLACLDYSAVKFGRLVAYRMDGEAQLQADKFTWVYVDP